MKKVIAYLATLFACLFMTTACVKNEDTSEENRQKGIEYLEENAKKEGVVVTPSGLQYEVLRQGTGKTPRATDKVKCYYRGRFVNGQMFDGTEEGSPATFPVNVLIPGWIEGLQLMNEGSVYRFTIPYELGYGPKDYRGIPAYSVLIFEIELLEVL